MLYLLNFSSSITNAKFGIRNDIALKNGTILANENFGTSYSTTLVDSF